MYLCRENNKTITIMNVQVERKDIDNIGHTCYDENGYLAILCSAETCDIEYILLRSILQCFGEDYKIVAENCEGLRASVRYITNLPHSIYLRTNFKEKKETRIEFSDGFQMGDWGVSCMGRTLKVDNDGIKLAAREEEGLEKMIFDVENKTVTVKVKNPTLSEKAPRIVDLSDAPEFFEELRNGLETLLTTKYGTFGTVKPNADRTVFKISEIMEFPEGARKHLERWGHLVVGPWRANCCENTFKLENNGIQLAARGNEDLEKIIFDVEKKTVAVSVKNPLLPDDTPRVADLSDAPEFFEELRNDIEILLGKPELVKANADRTVFEISGIKVFKIESESGFQMGNWSASCWGKTFKLNNHGIKLVARSDEGLEKVIFDAEKKTVAVKVKNPTLPEKCPRIVDLSDAPEFFEELHNDLEKLLTIKGKFKSVTPNADRTVFEVS